MRTEEIYNYIKINDQIITGGQPTAEQLKAAAAEGFTTVINLATFSPGHSLKDEAGLVQSLGIAYYPIPVDWGNPTESDFAEFEHRMMQIAQSKTLIHCAANYRATAFYALYAQKHLGWTESQGEQFRAAIWKGSDYPVWEEFITRMKTQFAQE